MKFNYKDQTSEDFKKFLDSPGVLFVREEGVTFDLFAKGYVTEAYMTFLTQKYNVFIIRSMSEYNKIIQSLSIPDLYPKEGKLYEVQNGVLKREISLRDIPDIVGFESLKEAK